MNSGGGSFFNADRTACALDTPESIAGLEFYQNLYASGAGVPFGEDAEPPYKAGTLGMFINGRWATPGAREITSFNWDVAPLPTGPAPGKNWLFWGAYVVNANTADPAAAWKLVEALTSTEVQGKISELGANIPSRTSQEAIDAFLTYTPPANNQAFVDGISERSGRRGSALDGQLAGLRQGRRRRGHCPHDGQDHDRRLPEEHLQGHRGGLGVALPARVRVGELIPGPHPRTALPHDHVPQFRTPDPTAEEET